MTGFAWSDEQRRLRERWARFGRKIPGAGAGALRKLAATGLLHPASLRAGEYQAVMDGLGYAGVDAGALFMAQAHLFGAWAPLYTFRPDLAEKVGRRRQILALAVTESRSGSDVYGMQSRARKTRRGWALDGQKTFVTNGTLAAGFLLFARHAESKADVRTSCFFVPARAKGLKVTKMPERISLASADAGELRFRGLEVTEENLVGAPGAGAEVFRCAMMWERSLILSPASGRLERLRENLLKASARKIRFGEPLADKPAFRAKIAEVDAAIARIRERTAATAGAIDAGGNAMVSSIECKLEASRSFEAASRILLQLGGREALYAGSELEVNFRDSLASALYSGPNELLESLLEQLRD